MKNGYVKRACFVSGNIFTVLMEFLHDEEAKVGELEATLFDNNIEASPYMALHDTPLLSPQSMTPFAYSADHFNLDGNTSYEAVNTETKYEYESPHLYNDHQNYNGYHTYHPRASVGSVGSYTPDTSYGSIPRMTSGKVTKPSPNPRSKPIVTNPEDDFALGEPAIDVADDDLDDRLRSALMATSKAGSRANSSVSSRQESRRASIGSGRSTPWILPRGQPHTHMQARSAGPSPLITAQYNQNEDVAENRNSKRQIHKLAEQERRNRMNIALSKLAAVLDLGPDKSANSKAATVERASVYIKQLQAQISDLKNELSEYKNEKHQSSSAEESAVHSAQNSVSPRSTP